MVMNRRIKKYAVVLISVVICSIVIYILIQSNSSESDTKGDELSVKSYELKSLVKNSWSGTDFGTKESVFDNYDIYFDEGLEVRMIAGKVYNIVFTEKYKKNIIGNIKSNTNLEEIIEELGQPNFGGKSINLIGYKFEDYYIFFNGKQASVYRNENIEYKNDIFTSGSSKKELFDDIIEDWDDFDLLIENINNGNINYALINYAYKGIRISVMGNQMEIIVYNNCNLKIPTSEMYKITNKNKNLIYEVECERQESIHNKDFAYEQYQSSVNNMPPDVEYSETESEYKFVQSNSFLEFKKEYTDNGEYKLLFVSINDEFPNSQLEQYVTSNAWLDDYNMIYGVNNQGIFLYNAQTRKSSVLKEGTGEFVIKGITKDNILKYDNSEITINI